jgi:hypothetical protein
MHEENNGGKVSEVLVQHHGREGDAKLLTSLLRGSKEPEKRRGRRQTISCKAMPVVTHFQQPFSIS